MSRGGRGFARCSRALIFGRELRDAFGKKVKGRFLLSDLLWLRRTCCRAVAEVNDLPVRFSGHDWIVLLAGPRRMQWPGICGCERRPCVRWPGIIGCEKGLACSGREFAVVRMDSAYSGREFAVVKEGPAFVGQEYVVVRASDAAGFFRTVKNEPAQTAVLSGLYQNRKNLAGSTCSAGKALSGPQKTSHSKSKLLD